MRIARLIAPTPRPALLLIAALCLAAVGVALVSQYHYDMPPCAWCVLQRLIYLVIAALALAGALAPERARRVVLLTCLLLAAAGIVAAAYQHSVAAQSLSCAMTFADRFMTATGLDAALPWLFGIYATCMDAAVTVLGVEYALWSLTLFAAIGAVALAGLVARRTA